MGNPKPPTQKLPSIPQMEDRDSSTKRQKRHEDDVFVQGYVHAVANLIMLHDEPTIAKDVLNPVTPVNWKIIDEYDRDVLAKVGLAPRRRKSRKGSSLEQEGNEVR